MFVENLPRVHYLLVLTLLLSDPTSRGVPEDRAYAVFRLGPNPKLEGTFRHATWAAEQNEMEIELSNSQDSYKLENGTLTVRSERGIGSITLRLTDSPWPTLNKIRFEYADGRGLRVLEGLEIQFDSLRLPDPQSEVVNGAREWLVPQAQLQKAKSLTILWIDFYR